MAYTQDQESDVEKELSQLGSRYKNMNKAQLAEEAMRIATRQIMSCTDFKKPRLEKIAKMWRLYDGDTTKKLRQLFNVPIPVFAGMVDTLNAQYDVPVQLKFKESEPSDYFKVQKVQGAFNMEVMSTAENSKWDSKLTLARKHAIINGIAIPKYTAESDPEYKSTLEITNIKHFNFQPRGGLNLENHLFAGEEEIEKTQAELIGGALNGYYEKEQVSKMIKLSSDSAYLPESNQEMGIKLSRFKPLGLNPDNHSYVGQTVYKLTTHIMEIDGTRWYLCFHPWTQTYLCFEKWKDICSSELYPWNPYVTHPDDENLLSKSYGDDLYSAADAIVAMFNQELTNREKQNNHSRAYDKDMFPNVKALDDAMHRPDGLVAADTKGGTRRISEGLYEFKVGELNGTVNLMDWISGTLGRNTGANELAQGSVDDVSKKASVTFAEQKSVSKRISWGSQPFQDMMGGLGKRYIYGLKDHMPSKMAIKLMGERGWDWDEITRLDLKTTKDIDVLIVCTEDEKQKSELQKEKRIKALEMTGASPNINGKKRDEAILRDVGEYDDQEVAEFLDVQTYSDKKSIAKASEAIDTVLKGRKPELWHGANAAFMQKIVDFASDKRTTLKDKYDTLIEYAMAHKEIAAENTRRKAESDMRAEALQQAAGGNLAKPTEDARAVPGGISRAMNIAEQAV